MNYEANFKYDKDKSIDLCLEYSDNPNLLKALIEKLEIKANRIGVEGSKWSDDKDLLCLVYRVTVNGFSFPFYGSHNAAIAFREPNDWRNLRKIKANRKRVNDDFLYSILCCIRCDYYTIYEDLEDIGLNPDSIKDVAKWNEIREHARKLQRALRLSQEELESLPS